MHQCLSLPEILDCIFRHMDITSQPLTPIVLTCRTWYSIAMRVQWAALENLIPLLLVLPVEIEVCCLASYRGLSDFSYSGCRGTQYPVNKGQPVWKRPWTANSSATALQPSLLSPPLT